MHRSKMSVWAAMALIFSAGATQAHSSGLAPASTAGLDIVLTIEHTESSLPGGFPTMGAVLQSYSADGTYIYAGFGGANQLSGTGTYTYVKTGPDTATEDAVQYAPSFTLPYHMEYTFVTGTAGRWKQYFAGGLIVFEGSFATSPMKPRVAWAPASLDGATIVLVEVVDGHRTETRIFHRRDAYVAQSSGDRPPQRGKFVARKLAARSLVVEMTDAGGALLVRSYTFTDRHGGYWKAATASDGATTAGRFRLDR